MSEPVILEYSAHDAAGRSTHGVDAGGVDTGSVVTQYGAHGTQQTRAGVR